MKKKIETKNLDLPSPRQAREKTWQLHLFFFFAQEIKNSNITLHSAVYAHVNVQRVVLNTWPPSSMSVVKIYLCKLNMHTHTRTCIIQNYKGWVGGETNLVVHVA